MKTDRMEREVMQSPYLVELKAELKRLDPSDHAHAARLMAEETKRVESGDKYKSVPTIELHHDRPTSNSVKIRIPANEFPKVNFSGKLLGPKGSTLKQLQQETGCKLSILGKGSMRDKSKEEELRKEGGKYAHLNEELHVLIECFAESTDGYSRLAHAVGEIKKFMNPDDLNVGGMGGPPQMEERGFYNGEGSMGRGSHSQRGGPVPRGAPGGRGGLLSTPGGRGGISRGGAPAASGGRGAPPQRGAPAMRGAPPMRGAPSMRGAPQSSSMRGAPQSASTGRGSMPPSRGIQRAAPVSRGGASVPRGRGLAPPTMTSRPPPTRAPPQVSHVQEYDDYGASAGAAYDEPAYGHGQDTYEDSYTRRDPYAEDPYSEQTSSAGGGDTQYFDYGHGPSQGYDDYEAPRAQPSSRAPAPRAPAPRSHAMGGGGHAMGGGRPATSGYERSAPMKAPPVSSRGRGGMYRSQPY